MHSTSERESYFRTLSLYTGKSIRVLKFREYIRNLFKRSEA